MNREHIYTILREVTDPEIPVVTIEDLGILRNVEVNGPGTEVTVFITPTYSGCPAMDMISSQIKETLTQHGIADVTVISLLEPIWTTDWITESGKQKLLAYGIAPPVEKTTDTSFLTGKSPVVACPQCRSLNTQLVSRFGSTPCKALYKCNDCLEPFDYFKCH
jgi:ring-1,2-phenylacetyl-CoA epoxidase subunit PaaD